MCVTLHVPTFRAAVTMVGPVAVTVVTGPHVHTAAVSGAGVRLTPLGLTAAQLMALVLWKVLR